jgi:hypothetical protein
MSEKSSWIAWSLKCRISTKCWGLRMKRHPSTSAWCSSSKTTSQLRKIWGTNSIQSSICSSLT